MRYELSIERSTELLRQALPLMARQAAALHPVSYAVWFDYVAQTNPPLRAAVDEHIAREGVLDEFATQALFTRHIADVDPETAQRVVDDMQRMLGGIGEVAGQTGAHAARFGESLSRLAGALELGETSRGIADPDPDREAAQARTLSMMVADVIADTGTMRRQLGGLAQRLGESRREIERLRDEVRRAREEALRDSLTGLANRRAFDQALAVRLGERNPGRGPQASAAQRQRSVDAAQAAIRTAMTPPPGRGAREGDARRPAVAAPTPSASAAPSDPVPLPDATSAPPAQASGELWMLLTDVDNLRQINETYGRGFGDQVLKTVADALNGLTPSDATLARVGGEAFALLLPGLDTGAALELAERMRRHVGSARIRRQNQAEPERITLSLGLAGYREGETTHDFVARAARALHDARVGGRDRVVVLKDS